MNTLAQLRTSIVRMIARRLRKLFTMSEWRKRHPNSKRDWINANSDHVKRYESDYRKANFERKKSSLKAWKLANKAHVKAMVKASRLKDWERFKRSRNGRTNRYNKHPHVAMKVRLRALIQLALKGKTKPSTTETIVGCSAKFFEKWIASKFLHGMSYDNRNQWQLDHVFPTACCGKNLDQIMLAQNYRNLRPMWREENHSKSYKLTDESIVSAFLCGINEIHLTRPQQVDKSLLDKARLLGFTVFNHYRNANSVTA